MRWFFALCCCGLSPVIAAAADSPAQPNVLVMLADDLGFSDLGCYGSEIDTPHLDRLAANGVRFTQFYNTAKCHSSRVSLLTGRWCRQAGDQNLTRATTIPEALAPAGYFTAMTGKWHLSQQPTDFGFQRYFGHLSGACNYYRGDNSFRLNGQSWKPPAQGFYTTTANVDHALTFLAEARTARQPWCLYMAFNAPHAPLQPLEADYRKYLGRYDVGWDVIRAGRVERQRQLGLFGAAVEPAPRPDHIPAWDTLAPETQRWEARRMAAYAGLIDRVDQEIGRLLEDLTTQQELDNTLILFCSDNGACPYDRRNAGADGDPFDPDTSWSDSTGWAWARNSPFRYYKQNQFEGGIATPAIWHWPRGIQLPPGTLVHAPAHLVDVLPTLCDVTGAKLPETYPGRELTPLAGVSLAAVFAGRPMTSRPPIHLLFGSDRGLRDGDWKLVSFQSQPWELYNLAQDRTELHDLAPQHPDIVARMAQQWHELAEHVLRSPPNERRPVAEQPTGHKHREWSLYTNGANTSSRGSEATPRGKPARPGAAARAATDGASADRSTLPRARKGTRLTVDGQQLVLECTGDDPGLAFDRLGTLPAGPYTLTFRLQSAAAGNGELFWTTDAGTTLPQGHRLEFAVTHDAAWHDVAVPIPEPKSLHALRLDPCGGPGHVRLEAVRLLGAGGTVLMQSP